MGRDHFEDLGIYRKVILKMDPKEIEQEDVNWINLARDKDKLWALVNVVMKFWVP
jgi:hypothetical protein